MLGKDGRIYDRSFDSDHDGSLNAYERSMMDSIVFGEDSDEKSYMEDESDDIEYSLALEGVDLDDLEDMSEGWLFFTYPLCGYSRSYGLWRN